MVNEMLSKSLGLTHQSVPACQRKSLDYECDTELCFTGPSRFKAMLKIQ